MGRLACFPLLVAVLLMGFDHGPTYAQDAAGNLNLFVGQRFLDDDDWEPVEQQWEGGLELDYRGPSWPVYMEMAVFYSTDDETETITEFDPTIGFITASADLTATFIEFDLGIKKVFDEGGSGFAPFIGLGLSATYVEAEIDVDASGGGISIGASTDDDDTVFGGWAALGAYFTLGSGFNLGAEARYSLSEDASLFGEDFKTSSWHVGALVGYHWGGK